MSRRIRLKGLAGWPGLWLGLGLAVLLSGCVTDDHQDLKVWMQEASKDIKGHIPPLPEIKPFPVVSYDAADVVEPFSPAKIEPEKRVGAGGSGLKPDLNRYREPLEAYPLEALRMVGVLREKNRVSAVVLADKAAYTVRVGNYIGQNFGRIVRITDSEIQLKELVQDSDDEWVEREAALQLQEQENKK
ncbi:MAG: pilus assembly protein PilP [Sterolibacterium sp.]|jgi:type IV pilus assembly protein PilP|nr:pilus assembly protein PilP [Sterolibacterium sp.]MBP9799876.1 pilus assembly protein PilP [Sterolibacterium sp.]